MLPLFDTTPEIASAFDQDWSAGTVPGTTQNADPWQSGGAGDVGIALGTGTGQHGIEPTAGTIGSGIGMGGAIASVKDWLNTPFKTPLDPTSIFLIVGVILFAVIAWNLVLFHIRIAAEAI
jgi:hypothetical protein